jgi:hypothetical protein
MAADQHVHRRQEGGGQGSGDPGDDELTTTGYGHGIRLCHGEVGRRALAGLTAASTCRIFAQGPFRCNCRALRPYQPFGCWPDGQADGPELAPDRRLS